MADIRGINHSYYMHKIRLEEGKIGTIKPQCKLNLIQCMVKKEVVKKETIKLLNAGVTYPIFYSSWVSPIQSIPKKGGTTVIVNSNNKLIPSITVIGWHMDYRKLNVATKKEHLSLPFIDQMLDRLAGKEFYCFLNGYSRYNQILIALEDQEKTTFACPIGTFAF
ncbi:uncharacterized protein LOC120084130 [Benincasa hispida]|uniref:uncharacterized protein LOC120084130 n=1 Tax=Benincasa hispida TaxID=102211 RepID=UPI0018FFD9B4|nr:uncharacterized protein LOC120084130 [Benincasa hispida]